jgi:molecular chaperone GrpE
MSEPLPAEPKDTTQVAPPQAGPNQASPANADPKLEEQLAAAKQEAAANYDRFTRAVADLENYRKRTIREKDELRQFASSSLMEDVIPVLDNLSLGLGAARLQNDVAAIVTGVTSVLEQFKNTLARHGLKEINPTGQRFDPHFHECIAHQPSQDIPEENVMQVVRLGYSLNGRLLRPASVIVSSGPAKDTTA